MFKGPHAEGVRNGESSHRMCSSPANRWRQALLATSEGSSHAPHPPPRFAAIAIATTRQQSLARLQMGEHLSNIRNEWDVGAQQTNVLRPASQPCWTPCTCAGAQRQNTCPSGPVELAHSRRTVQTLCLCNEYVALTIAAAVVPAAVWPQPSARQVAIDPSHALRRLGSRVHCTVAPISPQTVPVSTSSP